MDRDITAGSYDWRVHESASWPPSGRPVPPLGPTQIEVMRSCPLRACFERSTGYERRMSFTGRIGTAFHMVLQSLVRSPLFASSPADAAADLRRRFASEMRAQEVEADARPREKWLPRDDSRSSKAIEALLSISWSNATMTSTSSRHGTARLSGSHNVEVEVPVTSSDGLLKGRVDRAEHSPNGVRLLDYKSALRGDLPERYERQLQLYAVMWWHTKGSWPVSAHVIYPLIGSTHDIAIEPETCENVYKESIALIKQAQSARSVYDLGTPGAVCTVCEFRPWCKPFWDWQAQEKSYSVALERATLGFEGEIVSLRQIEQFWKVQVAWRSSPVDIVAPLERFPQLHQARVGMRLRALEMRLRGMRSNPRAMVTERSEIFLLE